MANLITVDYIRSNYPTLDLALYPDATISGMISRASKRVENILQYDPSLHTVTDETKLGKIDQDNNLLVIPDVRPVQSITSLSIIKGTSDISLTLTSGSDNKYNLVNGSRTIVYPDNELTYTGAFYTDSFSRLKNTRFFTKMTYLAGYETIPDDIQEATGLLFLDIINRNSNLIGASSIKQGDVTISYNNSGDKGKSDNTIDAENLLSDYVRHVS